MKKLEPVYFLIVDDLPENILSIEALLKRDELVLLKAQSGPEALELLLQHDVALALLDVQMPGMDGFELAELMRSTQRTRQVPIIFLTAGIADYQRRFRGYEAGAVDFLTKPIEADILKSKVAVFFELYRQRQEVAAQRDELREIAEENKRYSLALQEADQRKDEFLATLAHELRNPMAPLRNGLVLLNNAKEHEHAKEIKTMMQRQLMHLVRLVDDLLDVSRISLGKIELKRENINFQSALQAALEASQPVIDSNHHTITVSTPEKPVYLSADITRIAQILSNLLNNAAKYTPAGGHIKLEASTQNDELVISITDNGIGIAPDMLPKVFELFSQVESALDRSQGGLGIGLALVKQLVHMHDGNIDVQSNGLKQGSTFTVHFPTITAQENAAENATSATLATTSQPRKILVVDDNIPSAQTTGWMLEMMNHDYTLAHDGMEAIEVAKTYDPDIILLDIGLPKMNGYDVCRALRADPAFKNVTIIAQTGWAQKKDREMAQEAGFDHHLVKPVDYQKISELIDHLPARK